MFSFQKTTKGMSLMAAFMSGIIQAGLAFKVSENEEETTVSLTGGY